MEGSFCSNSCDMDEVYDEYDSEVLVATKTLKCHECYNPIIPGESYEHAYGLMMNYDEYDSAEDVPEEDWDNWFTCSRCLDLRNSLSIFSCYGGDIFHTELLDRSLDYIYECMIPNLPMGKKYMAIPYYKKYIKARGTKAQIKDRKSRRGHD